MTSKHRVMFWIPIGVSITTILVLLFHPYMSEGDFLSKWAAVVTILSLASTPAAYFARQNETKAADARRQNDERILASKNLYGELENMMDAFNDPGYLLDVTLNNSTAQFTNRFLNHDIYDGLVFSGRVGFLRYESQQSIQDTFQKIKNHNYYLRHVVNLQDANAQDTFRYYKLLEAYEISLIEKTPQIMEELKKEF